VDGGIHHTFWSQWKGKDKIRATSKGYPLHQIFLLAKSALNDTIRMVQGAGFEPAL
tara:strand:+ start:763 stop:930 length:168 start_codon:yes stop_codon:yes gene_type:complete